MKVQAAALFLGLVLAVAGHAAPTAPDLKDDPRWKAAEALTQEQIQASTDRNSLARLADLYNGRDFDRFVWTLERLVALTPNSGELKLQLASVYASRDMKSKAYDTLVHMQVQGFGYDLQGDERFEKVNGTKVWTYIVENLRANAKPFGEGKVAFSLPKGDRLLESLDWDPKRQKFLVGSAREGVVYLADKSGATESFIAPDAKAGLWSVLALRADPERDLLWVLSDGVKVFKGFDADMLGKAWLMKYQLSSGKLLGQYAPPEASGGHILTSLAVGKGGRVYVADAVRREIYQLDGEQLKLLAANQAQFVVGSGDQVILARSQGLPVVYVMNWYRRFPVAVFSLQPLTSPQDLKGKRVGIPGPFGATYVGLKGLLYAAKVDEKQVDMPTVGFTQVESLLSGQVDAAVGYSMNEPLQLQQAGKKPYALEVSQYIDLVANGLITNEQTIQTNPDLVRRMVRATLRGLRDTLANPAEAFDITLKAVPEAAKTADAQRATLDAAIAFWQSDQLGRSDPQAWETSATFMKEVGLIPTAIDVNKAFTNDFISPNPQ